MTETVLFQQAGQSAVASTTLTINVSSNPAGAGNKKIIFVGAIIRDSAVATARTISSVIFDGSLALTSIVQRVNSGPMASTVAIFAANLTGVGTGNLVATSNAIGFWKGAVIIADDLDQAAAAITAVSSSLGDDPVSGGGLAVDGISNVASFAAAVDYALAEAAGQTEITGCPLVDADGAANERNFSASYRAGGSGSQSFAWTSPNARAAHAVALFPRVSGGSSPIAGTLTTTLSPATTTSAGKLAIAGAATATLSPATAAGVAALAIAGAATAMLLPATATSAGALAIAAGLTVTLDPATVAGAGSVVSGIAGTLTTTLSAATTTSAAALAVAGTVTALLDPATSVAAGRLGGAEPSLRFVLTIGPDVRRLSIDGEIRSLGVLPELRTWEV